MATVQFCALLYQRDAATPSLAVVRSAVCQMTPDLRQLDDVTLRLLQELHPSFVRIEEGGGLAINFADKLPPPKKRARAAASSRFSLASKPRRITDLPKLVEAERAVLRKAIEAYVAARGDSSTPPPLWSGDARSGSAGASSSVRARQR